MPAQGAVAASSAARIAIASARLAPHICGPGFSEAQNAGRSGLPNRRQRSASSSCTQGTPAGLPCGMPGIGEVIDGAVQQAAQPARQAKAVSMRTVYARWASAWPAATVGAGEHHEERMPAQAVAGQGRGQVAASPALAILDTYREVLTPEGVALHLPAAGPVPRALAWLVDLLVRGSILLLLGMLLGLLGRLGEGLYSVGLFLVFWAYPIVLEAAWNGQTPGKRALGLRVVAGDGAPVGWLPAVVRNLMRTVDMLPFGYATGLVACLCDRDGRRLGDLVADTVVVHVAPRRALPLPPPATPLAPGQPKAALAAGIIVAFGERAPRLPAGRQAELAALLQPLTGSAGGEGVRRVYGMASWLLGRR